MVNDQLLAADLREVAVDAQQHLHNGAAAV
jgi:hypothetical protein